jgi:hypothetical protein
MFKKNLYAFSALLALSCSVYAMEERDDLSSSVESGGGRKALRSSSASRHADELDTAIGEKTFEPFPKDAFLTDFPLEFDFSASSESLSPKMTASPASSTQSSLFPDGNAKVTFTLLALRQASGDENPNRDPRAEALYNFIEETFFHYRHQLDWESTVVHTLPILAKELDDDSFWETLNDSKNQKKLGVSLRVYPKRQEVIDRLGETLGEYCRSYRDHHKRDVGLRKMALRAANRITELEDELKAFKAEAAELRTSLETERAIRCFKERCSSRK